MKLTEWSFFIEEKLHRPAPLIRVNGKAPLDRDWPSGPFEEPDTWRKKLVSHKGNVGLVMGRGLAALDVDLYKSSAQDSLDALVDATKLDLATITSITGRGGRHYLFSYEPELHVPSIPLEPLGYPGIELKAEGGMVVVAPSIHPDTGQAYCWEVSYGPGDTDPRAFPRALLALVGAVKGRSTRTSGRWRPLREGQVEELDQRDVEVARFLCEHFDGHDPVRFHDGTIGVYRPGKDRGSLSITIGHIGPGVGKCWSSNWPPFVAENRYDIAQLKDMAGLVPEIVVPDVAYELPPGYRIWREGDDLVPTPILGADAYHGLIGDFLRLVEGETEGHPAAIGAHLIPCFGTLLGREVAYQAGTEIHYPKLHVAVVGPTSAGVKGVSENAAMLLVDRIKPDFLEQHSMTGVGSGEVVITEMRDDADPPTEKRRIVLDAELSSLLRVVRREGSILGDVVRKTFDNRSLRNSTKSGGVEIASGHHLSIVGSTTPGELRALTEQIAILNGFSNRFLHVWSELTIYLPIGGHIDDQEVRKLAEKFTAVQTWVRQNPAVNGVCRWYRITKGTPVFDLWDPFFTARREGAGDSETMRAITGRQVAHAARIALVYAVLDRSDHFEPEHIRAAIAWCDYALGTIDKVFIGGPGGKAGQLLAAIRDAGADGLDGVAQDRVFQGNLKAGELVALREVLQAQSLIVTTSLPTGGRPRLTSYPIAPVGPTDKRIRRIKGGAW